MDLTPYVDQLRGDLQRAAEVGDQQGRAAAERLLIALDPAARLTLMDAVTQAAAEVTSELPSGAVEVRLVGRELDFVVDLPTEIETLLAGPAAPTAPTEPEDDALARVTLRLPEAVKKRAEELAGESGQSLNTWLVNAVRAATLGVPRPFGPAPPGAPPGPGFPPGPFAGDRRRRLSGWL